MRGVWNWIVTRTADYGLPKQIELIDIVQILLIAFFVYHLIRWLQNTKAYTLMKGIFLIGVFVIIANVLKMQTILWLFGNIGGAAITAVVIIFQPELRRVVEQIGDCLLYTSRAEHRSSPERQRQTSRDAETSA